MSTYGWRGINENEIHWRLEEMAKMTAYQKRAKSTVYSAFDYGCCR